MCSSDLATYDTASAGTANEVTGWNNTVVLGRSGSFSSIANYTPVSIVSPWFFNTSTPISDFWQVGGFSFELLSSSIVTQGSGAVYVSGVGTVSGNGYEDTTLYWSFTSQDPSLDNDGWTFSASTTAVPEPSTVVAGALLLLPFGVSTMRILRKNKVS